MRTILALTVLLLSAASAGAAGKEAFVDSKIAP